ncbi:MAG: HAMP domain-containing sensor histidine kinase [Thermodesulfobacteriota bacterium]
MKYRPKLRTVLLLVNLTILVLPLGSIAALRIYETELVKRTESELLAQGVLVGLVYRERLLARLGERSSDYGTVGVSINRRAAMPGEDYFHPIRPVLDVAKEHLRPPVADAREPKVPADPDAAAVGGEMAGLLQEAQRATLAGIRIVDWRGTVVASTGIELGKSLAHREEVSRALTGESVSLLYQRREPKPDSTAGPLARRTRYRVNVALSIVHQDRVWGAVVLMRTPLDVSKALYYHLGPLIIGALIVLAVVLVVTLLTSLTISRPLNRLIAQIQRFSRGEKGAAPVEKTGTREIELLARAFSEMTEKLEERADYINAFVSNVSHGFKTPLASTRAAVELLQDHLADMTGEERARFLDIIARDTERLERLVRRLTELARADVVQASGETAILPAVLDDLVEAYRAQGLEVTVRYGPEVDAVAMDRETLESVVTNLLDNARQHGGPRVRVEIETHGAVEGMVRIAVRDDGPGVSKANADRIFRPFFTTAKEKGGSGLGLPIVESLLRAHGGSITLETTEPGACFLVILPAAG